MSSAHVCKDCGGVWALLNQMPAGSNAMHEVSHDLLFTTKLIRVWGDVIEAVLLIRACCHGRAGPTSGPS